MSATAGPETSGVSAPKSPAKMKKKSRLAVRKQKEAAAGTPRRSPRVQGTSASPPVLASKKASPSPKKKAAPASRLKKSVTAKDPAPAVKAGASIAKRATVKVKKSATVKGKQVSAGKAKKLAGKSKTIHFEKDAEYVDGNMDDDSEDEELISVSFNLHHVLRVVFIFYFCCIHVYIS